MLRGMAVGSRIRLARGKRSRAAVARDLGVDTKTVYRWETGLSKPEFDQIEPLARALSVNVDWLVTGEGPRTPAGGPLEATGTEG